MSGTMRTPREHWTASGPVFSGWPGGVTRADVHVTPARTRVSYTMVLVVGVFGQRVIVTRFPSFTDNSISSVPLAINTSADGIDGFFSERELESARVGRRV